MEDIVLGLKCGSSDTTHGLSATPVIGCVTDQIVEAGGTAFLGEIREFIGAEHIVAKHAATKEVGEQILNLVSRMENRAKAVGSDMRAGSRRVGTRRAG